MNTSRQRMGDGRGSEIGFKQCECRARMWVRSTFPQQNIKRTTRAIQKLQGPIQKPKDQLQLWRPQLPRAEKRVERLLHLCERFRTEQDRLEVRRVICVVRRRFQIDRKSTRLNSSHIPLSRMPS